MLSKWFNRNKNVSAAQAAPVTAPQPASAAHDPYEFMSNAETRDLLRKAVLEDDLGVVKSIARHHPDCAKWVMESTSMWIGGEPYRAPLHFYAITNGHRRILQWLIDNGADIDARGNFLNETALYHAARLGQTECVRTLIAAGADPHTQTLTHTPMTASDAARAHGHQDCARVIEEAQINAGRAEMAVREDRVLKAPRVTFKKS